jgi:hypothetical protein
MSCRSISTSLLVLATIIMGNSQIVLAANFHRNLVTRQSTGNSSSPYFDRISDHVNSIYDDLRIINKAIYDNPELGYKAYEAHDLLASFFEDQEWWNVTRSVRGVETAFQAVFDGKGEGPVIGFNAE